MNRRCWMILLSALLAPVTVFDRPAAQEPTTSYEVRDVEGWTVRIHRDFARDEPDLAARTLSLLADQLRAIDRVVPAEAVAKLEEFIPMVKKSTQSFCMH